MKNIHVLPTDKPSRLFINPIWEHQLRFVKGNLIERKHKERLPQHIYITSDEEIKEGDVVKIPCGVGKVKELNWKFGNNNPSYIVEDIFIYKLRYGQKEGELQINSFRYEDVKKIILTTDQDLIKDGVQAIDDEFLEWFVKNPSCEFAHLGFKSIIGDSETKRTYKIIIPKKEPKQETLEEAAENYTEFWLQNKGLLIKDAFIAGTKWQAERMYSEEDIKQLFESIISEIEIRKQNIISNSENMTAHLLEGGCMAFESSQDVIKEQFEQFKKKKDYDSVR